MIRKVTITGADNSIRPGTLKDLSVIFPFVEWGILVSRRSMGNNRFPDLEWLDELSIIKKGAPDMKLSMHLCGAYVREILMGDASFVTEIGTEVFDMFERVQINTHGQKHDYNAEKMVAFMNSCTGKEFIFQFDNVNEVILNAAAIGGVNCSTLFDMSHGAGILPGSWPMPLEGIKCGYAGGLSCENLVQQMGFIEDKVGETEIWIDVETKVRSNSDKQFDLGLVKNFLEISGTHIKTGMIQQRGNVALTESEQDFANHVGYEVKLLEGGTGINMGLYFPEKWAEDGILKANGVNVFFPEQNKIYALNFNQVELIFPNGITRMNQAETLYGFVSWLTTRETPVTFSSKHGSEIAVELIEAFSKVNNLPIVRGNWTDNLVGMGQFAEITEPYEDGKGISTKHTSQCLKKAKDDEPIFVLRSTDPTAPKLVRDWASVNEGVQPEEKIAGAWELAGEMENWHKKNCK